MRIQNDLDLSEFKPIGVIGVDAELCWIGDPCYIMHEGRDASKEASRNAEDWAALSKAVGTSWHGFCDILHGKDAPMRNVGHQQFNYPMGHAGLGVVTSTGWGDGEYTVYVRKSEGRIAQVLIDFAGDMDTDLSEDEEQGDDE